MRLHDTATPANRSDKSLERVNADRRLHDTPATPANRSDTSFEEGGKREATRLIQWHLLTAVTRPVRRRRRVATRLIQRHLLTAVTQALKAAKRRLQGWYSDTCSVTAVTQAFKKAAKKAANWYSDTSRPWHKPWSRWKRTQDVCNARLTRWHLLAMTSGRRHQLKGRWGGGGMWEEGLLLKHSDIC